MSRSLVSFQRSKLNSEAAVCCLSTSTSSPVLESSAREMSPDIPRRKSVLREGSATCPRPDFVLLAESVVLILLLSP